MTRSYITLAAQTSLAGVLAHAYAIGGDAIVERIEGLVAEHERARVAPSDGPQHTASNQGERL